MKIGTVRCVPFKIDVRSIINLWRGETRGPTWTGWIGGQPKLILKYDDFNPTSTQPDHQHEQTQPALQFGELGLDSGCSSWVGLIILPVNFFIIILTF